MSRRPGGDTFGSMRRSCDAANGLLRWLADYPPVLEAFMAWSLARGITPDRLRRAQSSSADDSTLAAAIHRDSPEALAMLTTFAQEQLQLPFAWVPALLLENFQLWVANIVDGRPRQIRQLRPDDLAQRNLPKGRGPRRTLDRDVVWYCRAHIAQEPATTLATEYAQAEHRHTAADSVVSEAIDRVEAWLAGIVVCRPPT